MDPMFERDSTKETAWVLLAAFAGTNQACHFRPKRSILAQYFVTNLTDTVKYDTLGTMLGMNWFGDKIRQRREQLGLSKADVEQRCGISRTVYYHLEEGTRLPREGHIRMLARALELPEETVQLWADYQRLGPGRAEALARWMVEPSTDPVAQRVAEMIKDLHPKRKQMLYEMTETFFATDSGYRKRVEAQQAAEDEDERETEAG